MARCWAPVSGKGSRSWKRRTSSPPTSWRTPSGVALEGPLAQHQRQLDAQQLVEDQPPPGLLLRPIDSGQVDAVQRRGAVDEAEP